MKQKIAVTLLLSMLMLSLSLVSVRADDTNLEPLTAFYSDMNGAASSYATLDTSVTHSANPSIRVGPDYVRETREVDGSWIAVSPGDRIVFSAWIKTEAFSTSYTWGEGGRIGMDFYIHSNLGYGIATLDSAGHQAGHPRDIENVNDVCRVKWGNDWTQVTWDIVVPSQAFTYVTISPNSLPYAPYSVDPVYIDSMVPWFDVGGITDNAYAWFTDSILQVNPDSPNPTPTPTPTNTATPAGPTPHPTYYPNNPFNNIVLESWVTSAPIVATSGSGGSDLTFMIECGAVLFILVGLPFAVLIKKGGSK